MTADRRRCVPVRLSDLPLHVRLEAARHVTRHETSPDGRLDLLLAALSPSDTVYWVTNAAAGIEAITPDLNEIPF